MGLSKDPAKARRQLEGLATGAERRAASLRARIAQLDAPGEQPRPSEPSPEPAAAAASGTIVAGRYGSTPPPAAAPATEPALEEAVDGETPTANPAPATEPAPEAERGPSRGSRLAAAALAGRRR